MGGSPSRLMPSRRIPLSTRNLDQYRRMPRTMGSSANHSMWGLWRVVPDSCCFPFFRLLDISTANAVSSDERVVPTPRTPVDDSNLATYILLPFILLSNFIV